jgi:hypothetical protein
MAAFTTLVRFVCWRFRSALLDEADLVICNLNGFFDRCDFLGVPYASRADGMRCGRVRQITEPIVLAAGNGGISGRTASERHLPWHQQDVLAHDAAAGRQPPPYGC